MEVLLGTTNPSKVAMFEDMLGGCGIVFRTPRDLGIAGEPEEEGRTPEENAAIKARYYGRYFDRVICNDAGLYFAAIPYDDPRQPGLHIRTPQGGPRMTDDEMIAYYSALARSLGGKTLAEYPDAFAVWRGGRVFTFMETGGANGNIFYMTCEPAEKRHPGWPLDSLSLYRYSNAYFVDEPYDRALPESEKEARAAYHGRLIRFLKEALGVVSPSERGK